MLAFHECRVFVFKLFIAKKETAAAGIEKKKIKLDRAVGMRSGGAMGPLNPRVWVKMTLIMQEMWTSTTWFFKFPGEKYPRSPLARRSHFRRLYVPMQTPAHYVLSIMIIVDIHHGNTIIF